MKPIHVVAAVIEDPEGRILIARRPAHAHLGGLWEFPGGKLEPGEGPSAGLAREIREELGILVTAHRPLIRLVHHYPGKSIRLDVHRVLAFEGVAEGCEGQPIAWVDREGLAAYPMPPADRPILAAIDLPDRYLITGGDPREQTPFFDRLEQALRRGVRLVQLRAPGLDEATLIPLARIATQRCEAFGARLLLNGSVEAAQAAGAHGVHLNRHRLRRLVRRPTRPGFLVGASCHDRAELERAVALATDFAVLSPVLPTASHPEATPLGWSRFEGMVADLPLPVFALGGMHTEHMEQAWAAGAQGIAAIRGLWPGMD